MKKIVVTLTMIGGLSACTNEPGDIDSDMVALAAAAAAAIVLAQ